MLFSVIKLTSDFVTGQIILSISDFLSQFFLSNPIQKESETLGAVTSVTLSTNRPAMLCRHVFLQ